VGLETRPPPEERPKSDASEAAPVESRDPSPAPVPEKPAPAASVLDPPPIGDKADDLDAIKKAVDDAASVGGGLWLSYLFVLFYLAVAAGAVTHADLFLENPVKLPFLNIELPLLTFFSLAPILFLVVHAYTLVHLVMLTEKAKRFHQALHDSRRNVDAAARESLQWQLPSNIFIQFLVGPPGIRGGLWRRFTRDRMDYSRDRAGPAAAHDAGPVPAVSQPLHHLDASHRLVRRSAAARVAVAQGFVRP
jgi:hypothetical protein